MRAVAHDATMREAQQDGGSYRAHLEAAARKGNAKAQAELDGPEIPESLAYLYHWFGELDRTRGWSEMGPLPITYPQVESWARLTQREVTPLEVEGLLMLDAVSRNPSVMADEEEVIESAAPSQAWPTKQGPSDG